MLLFKDILTGDELMSDVYPVKEIDGIVYEVDCRRFVKKPDGEVDIGANKSAEEPDEAEVDAQQGEEVIDVVDGFHYQSTGFDKKQYLTHLKDYMKEVKAKLIAKGAPADTVTAFEKGAQAYVKNSLLPKFKDWEFYIGESMNPDGMTVLLNYREDGTTPYVVLWKHGLEEMKV